jgi:hypothetical protein
VSLLLETFGWFWIGLGILSGAIIGMNFRREDFLGGYNHWRRRLVRLGHIAFVGTGMLCVFLAGSLARYELGDQWERLAAWCMVIGAVGMPTCCAIAAFRPRMTGVFVVPVCGIGIAVTVMYLRLGALVLYAGAGGVP